MLQLFKDNMMKKLEEYNLLELYEIERSTKNDELKFSIHSYLSSIENGLKEELQELERLAEIKKETNAEKEKLINKIMEDVPEWVFLHEEIWYETKAKFVADLRKDHITTQTLRNVIWYFDYHNHLIDNVSERQIRLYKLLKR